MGNQTFALLNAHHEEVGYISKNNDGMMLLSLKGFWGSLVGGSEHGKMINVDDFVGSVIDSENSMSAIIHVKYGMRVVFDNQTYSNVTEIRVYDSIAGLVFTQTVDSYRDVTGRVYLTE